jgi:class 3 adenylate cyclase
MDRHDRPGATAEDVAAAHLRDLTVQDRFGVQYVSYWFDYDLSSAFCLVDAPDEAQARAVHEALNGLTASAITPVDRGTVEMFLGRIVDPTKPDDARTAFRAIMFTDMEGSTDITQRIGDDAAMAVFRRHDSIIRSALDGHRGTEVKHTGDGIMSLFSSVTDALGCSIAVQQGIQSHNAEAPDDDARFRVRIATAGRICLSEAVRELAIVKRFPFGPVEELTLKGFDGPVRLVGLNWEDAEGA